MEKKMNRVMDRKPDILNYELYIPVIDQYVAISFVRDGFGPMFELWNKKYKNTLNPGEPIFSRDSIERLSSVKGFWGGQHRIIGINMAKVDEGTIIHECVHCAEGLLVKVGIPAEDENLAYWVEYICSRVFPLYEEAMRYFKKRR